MTQCQNSATFSIATSDMNHNMIAARELETQHEEYEEMFRQLTEKFNRDLLATKELLTALQVSSDTLEQSLRRASQESQLIPFLKSHNPEKYLSNVEPRALGELLRRLLSELLKGEEQNRKICLKWILKALLIVDTTNPSVKDWCLPVVQQIQRVILQFQDMKARAIFYLSKSLLSEVQ